MSLDMNFCRRTIAGVALVMFGSFQAATAGPAVAYFSNGSFGDLGREVPNMRAGLVAAGATVSDFSGITDAAFSAALAGADVLVIPEQEVGSLFPAMSLAARAAVTSFVSAGGGIIVAGDGSANAPMLLNGLFTYGLTQSAFTASGSTSLQAGAAGTAFAGGPAALGNDNGTELLLTSSLPVGSLNIYGDGSNTSVFSADFGSGNVVFLGFDWFDEPTPASWNTVLASALTEASSVPEPASLALFALGLLGLGASRRRLA